METITHIIQYSFQETIADGNIVMRPLFPGMTTLLGNTSLVHCMHVSMVAASNTQSPFFTIIQ